MDNGVVGLFIFSILTFLGGIIALTDREGMARHWGYWWNEDNPKSLKALEKVAASLGVLSLIMSGVCLLGAIVLLSFKR